MVGLSFLVNSKGKGVSMPACKSRSQMLFAMHGPRWHYSRHLLRVETIRPTKGPTPGCEASPLSSRNVAFVGDDATTTITTKELTGFSRSLWSTTLGLFFAHLTTDTGQTPTDMCALSPGSRWARFGFWSAAGLPITAVANSFAAVRGGVDGDRRSRRSRHSDENEHKKKQEKEEEDDEEEKEEEEKDVSDDNKMEVDKEMDGASNAETSPVQEDQESKEGNTEDKEDEEKEGGKEDKEEKEEEEEPAEENDSKEKDKESRRESSKSKKDRSSRSSRDKRRDRHRSGSRDRDRDSRRHG